MITRIPAHASSALVLAILSWFSACFTDWAVRPGCLPTTELSSYAWTRVSDQAAFPGSYNFPIFSIKDKIWALHGQGNWYSEDEGKSWIKAGLPPLGLNTGYQQYVQFRDSIYALGAMRGNYLNLKLDSRIARTTDMKTWEVVAQKSELPARVFYGATVFKGQMWLVGGFDGNAYYNDVWSSNDAIKWTRVAGNCPWAQRCNPSCLVFEGKMWLIGGGIIDGENFNDVWYSADGATWTRATGKTIATPVFGYSAIAFNDKIWLVGANRNGTFKSAMLVSGDGVTWQEQDAPWSPRGGVATCIHGNKLFMTGGKYSVTENGNIKFIYNNDVWCLARSAG